MQFIRRTGIITALRLYQSSIHVKRNMSVMIQRYTFLSNGTM